MPFFRSRNLTPRWRWPALAFLLGLLPVVQGLTGARIFFVRDLSSYFWGRYLWLRHAWLRGEFPLWDPYVGAGQAAHADAMHQMFLPPAVLARLVGSDVFGFNLWVLIPFPLGALGAWSFLSRRTSPPAAALGAMAFVACGPMISTGNFPNLSWTVAALPWVLWAADRLVERLTAANAATLAIAVALQAAAGEPVTLFSTLALTGVYTLCLSPVAAPPVNRRPRLLTAMTAGAAAALGLALVAIQLVPMLAAAAAADRAGSLDGGQDLWSLRPTALIETFWFHWSGDYYEVQSLAEVPWMPLLNTGREGLFISIYFGAPLLALATVGLAGPGDRRWRLFWLGAGLVSLLAAFGSYTPIYPILRDHVPPFDSFRFPIKYIAVACMAVAAAAASGWDVLRAWGERALAAEDRRRAARARIAAIGLLTVLALFAGGFALACVYAPHRFGPLLNAWAAAMGSQNAKPAEFMLATAPSTALPVVSLTVAAALLFMLATRTRRTMLSGAVLAALTLLVAGDVLWHASGVNPVMDAAYFRQPAWLDHVKADPDARIYVGGKIGTFLETMDVDASRAYVNAPGLTGARSRAALSVQAVFYPSAWGVREVVSYDLPVMWPKLFMDATEAFGDAGPAERERFLERTGARYRVLPQRRAGDRTPVMPIPQFWESFLFDFGPGVAQRASVVPAARLVTEPARAVAALFEPGWDHRQVTLLDRELPEAGTPGDALPPSARFVDERPNHQTLEATAPREGGYLVVLDTYADGWHVRVDGAPAAMARANGLFRGIHLAPGRHRIELDYSPVPLRWGAGLTALASLVVLLLFVVPHRRRRVHAGAADAGWRDAEAA